MFLDRDGVLNELIFNPVTGEYESPHTPEDLVMIDGVIPALRRLAGAGFALFLVSNQPSYAKGKTTLENIRDIHRRLDGSLRGNGIAFGEYFYCYHHPHGIVSAYSGKCLCRKPMPYFLLQAAREHGVDLASSWMVGDQDTDVECGRSAGCRTALVMNNHSAAKRGCSRPDVTVTALSEAADRIIHWKGNE
ncbi:D-glycero-alpha-D-manno-heptose-1,7-bisphosphate 7-phosphatase [Mycobacterium sp.]|uniref:D-glycero-alpha-D-manno-heptose-1,7-bisphosphate 7-phosphatase n=1 Tax=Mycobacterium sp. TaxID=1785 RepID=UPI003F9E88B7